MKTRTYNLEDRVEYYIRRGLIKYHRVGYIKAVESTLFGTRYFVCVASKIGQGEIDIVRPKQIFGTLEKKD